MALSPSGKEVAFVLDGNIFVTSVEYGTTRQITSTPEQERWVEFTPDGRSLIYDSERGGKWQIYKATIKDEKEKNFTYATEITEELLVDPEKTAFYPRVSPDGKKVAYWDNRTELRVIDLETKKINTALNGKYTYSYTDGDVWATWSPDSKWLLVDGYIGEGGWNNSDVAAVKADGSEIINLTESGYVDSNCKWSNDGKAILFQSDKNGYRSHGSWGSERDAYIMFLDSEAFDEYRMTKEELALLKESKETPEKDKGDKDKEKKGKGKKKEVKAEKKDFNPDFKYRKERTRRLTHNSSNMGDYYLTPEKDKLYYIARFEKGGDLWMVDLKEGETTLVKKDWGYGSLMPDSTGKKLFSLSNSGIKSIDLDSKDVKNVSFTARYDYSPSAEREYMYEHMKSLVNNKFHDVNLHGTDWEKYTTEYAKFLPYINNDMDFSELLSEVLGELNASHTGSGASFDISPLCNTAYLGAFYDESYNGDGLKIAEVIERGPIAVKTTSVKPGDIITQIDGEKILAGKDYFPLLAGKAGKRVRLTIAHSDGKTESIIVRPVSAGTNRTLLYKRWVDHNKAVTDSISGGRIGYVHITGMDSESFRTIYDEVLGKYRNCDAIVVDTRYNGGGWLHNDIALLFSGKKYVDYSPRGQYIGSDPFSQWTKPSAMLVNESNYSDAHGTPYVYKTLGLGKIVGAPVPGTMTAVWWETQVNPHIYFGVPQVTSLDINGNMLENQQLNPDVIIYNQPGDILEGTDEQLITAVKLLMEQTKNK
jgi:C-terminal processing protease CtpA/Prc/Tol biopolymer transport system component